MFDDAAAYERFMGRWSVLLAPRFLDAARLGAPRAVLDVGTGTGNLARAVAHRWPECEVLGVDPSPAFITAAREHPAGGGRVRFELGDALDLPLPDRSVDAALALLVLTFVPDAERAVAEMARVTRPGGVLAAVLWDYGRGMSMVRVLWDAAARLDPTVAGQDEGVVPLARPGGLADLWRRTGVDGVEDGALEVTRRFASFDDYWMPFLGGQGPAGAYVAGLPDAGRAALRAAVADELGPGPFELTSRAWWVRGTVPV